MQNLIPNEQLFVEWEDMGLLAQAASGNRNLPRTASELMNAVQSQSLSTPEGQAYIKYLVEFVATQAYTKFVNEALAHAYQAARNRKSVPAFMVAMGKIVAGEVPVGSTLAEVLDMNQDERLKNVIVDKGFLPYARIFYESCKHDLPRENWAKIETQDGRPIEVAADHPDTTSSGCDLMLNLEPNESLFEDWECMKVLDKVAGKDRNLPRTARQLLTAVDNGSLLTPNGQAYIRRLIGFVAGVVSSQSTLDLTVAEVSVKNLICVSVSAKAFREEYRQREEERRKQDARSNVMSKREKAHMCVYCGEPPPLSFVDWFVLGRKHHSGCTSYRD